MLTSTYTINGVALEMVATPLEMPWGSVYWLIEAHMTRPILPHIFRRVGELNWVAIEPTSDAACDKLQASIEHDLEGIHA